MKQHYDLWLFFMELKTFKVSDYKRRRRSQNIYEQWCVKQLAFLTPFDLFCSTSRTWEPIIKESLHKTSEILLSNPGEAEQRSKNFAQALKDDLLGCKAFYFFVFFFTSGWYDQGLCASCRDSLDWMMTAEITSCSENTDKADSLTVDQSAGD